MGGSDGQEAGGRLTVRICPAGRQESSFEGLFSGLLGTNVITPYRRALGAKGDGAFHFLYVDVLTQCEGVEGAL